MCNSENLETTTTLTFESIIHAIVYSTPLGNLTNYAEKILSENNGIASTALCIFFCSAT